MRKRIMVLLMTVMMLVMSAAPALAASDKPIRPQPVYPPGYKAEAEQANLPDTGRGNKFDHGNRPATQPDSTVP